MRVRKARLLQPVAPLSAGGGWLLLVTDPALPRPFAAGFDSAFLGVPLPLPVAPVPVVGLSYTHFTVLLDPARRLAAATAVNIDGSLLRELDRADDWQLDPRLPASQQAGEQLYARNALDRGHLVRRRDPVWGDPQTAAQANTDTFHVTNAAPQVAVFNQSKQLWNGLEDYVLERARLYRTRLSVLTGPVLAPDDPPYRGVLLPRRFWKIAAWTGPATETPSLIEPAGPGPAGATSAASAAGGLELAATGYLLDQTALLDQLDLGPDARPGAISTPPLGAFRTFQVPIADLAALTGLDRGPPPAADLLLPTRPVRTPPPPDRAVQPGQWRELAGLRDLQLT